MPFLGLMHNTIQAWQEGLVIETVMPCLKFECKLHVVFSMQQAVVL